MKTFILERKNIVIAFMLGALMVAFGFYANWYYKLEKKIENNILETKNNATNINTIVQFLNQAKPQPSPNN